LIARSLGSLLRNIELPRIIKVDGLLCTSKPRGYDIVCRDVGGAFHEEETHLMLHGVTDGVDKRSVFVDVRSNIGGFIVDVASTRQVRHVTAFEPNSSGGKSSMRVDFLRLSL